MSTTLKFHSNIYNRDAINDAIEAYQEFAKAELQHKKDGEYYVVDFTVIDKENQNILADEFSNFVLGGIVG
jgi:hypothetical protein